MAPAHFNMLTQHIKIILRYAPKVRDYLNNVANSNTSKAALELSHTWDTFYNNQINNINQSQLWLIITISLLLIYIITLLYALHKDKQAIQNLYQQTEQALQAHHIIEIKFKTLVESSSTAIMTLANGHFWSANPATLSMLGIESEEAMCKLTPADISPSHQPDGRTSEEAALQRIEQAYQDGTCTFEWIHQRANGETFPALVQLTILQIQGEKMLQAIVTDISELHYERKERKLLAQALQHTDSGICITTIDAHILYVNPAFERLTGYASEELLGQFVSIIRHPDTDPSIYESIMGILHAGQTWTGELPMRCKSGESKWVSRHFTPILNAANQVEKCVGIFRDVTKERQQSEKMEHSQRLESLGVLAGGIAHDFNNILTAILGNASIAEKYAGVDSPITKPLSRIVESSERAAELCAQMLAYSGKGQFVVEPLDLSQLVEKMIRLMEVSIAKNIVLKFHLADNLPAIEGDATQLQQVILNFITNASEAIGDRSGVISFSTGVINVDDAYLQSAYTHEDGIKEGRYVYLEVSDTGCGMDKETISKIFDPFFTTKFTGRGLGMSAVLGIVRGHHGALKIYSEPNQGTTFKFLLPALDEHTESIKDKNEPAGEPVHSTVLVVDDEEIIREVASMMLEGMSMRTMLAKDGIEAVEVYREHWQEIDAVLLDITMPRMDGQACFSELKRIHQDVKVILSSGYNQDDIIQRFGGKGFSGFIQKPYTQSALQETLRSILQKD